MGILDCRLSLSRKGLQERNKLILSSCLEVCSCCKAITRADDHVHHVVHVVMIMCTCEHMCHRNSFFTGGAVSGAEGVPNSNLHGRRILTTN